MAGRSGETAISRSELTSGDRRRGRFRRAAFFPCLIAAALIAQAVVQRGFEGRFPAVRMESLLYLPKGEHMKIMSLGFRNLMADALWVKAIGYFGGHNLTDKEYPWLYHILDQVTSLDPLFRAPYLFGGVVLAVEADSVPDSNRLLHKGMIYHPSEWRLPFYIGFNQFYYQKDPSAAADYIQAAVTLPGRPWYLSRLAASLMAKSGRREMAIAFLETVRQNTAEAYIRKSLEKKIRDLREGKIPEGLEGFLADEEEGRGRDH